MDLGSASSWVALGVTLLVTLYTWYSNSQSATKKDVSEHSTRLTLLESKVASLPDKDAFHKVEMEVTRMAGGMENLKIQMQPLASGIKRIEEFLLASVNKGRTR